MVERYAHLSARDKEGIAPVENSSTVFTTPARARIIIARNSSKSVDAPVAQVDRAAVS